MVAGFFFSLALSPVLILIGLTLPQNLTPRSRPLAFLTVVVFLTGDFSSSPLLSQLIIKYPRERELYVL